MKAEDVVNQLRAIVPVYSDRFTNTISLTLNWAAGIVTATSISPHTLETGDAVTISGAEAPFPISDLTFSGSIATAVTSVDHDLTEKYQKTIGVIGADQAEFNGEFDLLSVPNRRTFNYRLTSTPPISPATGSIMLLDPLFQGYKGVFNVTVVDPNTFTYPFSRELGSPAQGNPLLHLQPRISSAIDIRRLADSYTKQPTDNYWAFVVMGDVATSRDRAILSDATETLGAGDKKRVRQIEPFNVYVFAPTTTEIAARTARDSMEEVKLALLKALYGWVAPSVFSDTDQIQIAPTGDGFAEYTKAYYVHRFDFERSIDLVADDAVPSAFSRAWRDTIMQFTNPDGEVTMSAQVDQDDIPL